MARTLYIFSHSVFSRRTQLALAHKKLDVDVIDARADAAAYAKARELSPQGTMPVLDDDGRVLGDSTAIAHYLDHAYDDHARYPRLWPRGAAAADAFAIASLVDVTVNTLADMGTRYWPLRNDPAWKDVLGERMRRAQGAIDEVAARASRTSSGILAGDAWGAAEIWTLTATRWVLGMPARAPSSPLVAQVLSLGLRIPDTLVRWAEQHADRPDVRALYA